MKATQRRPSALLVRLGFALWGLALVLEVAALSRGEAFVVGIDLRAGVVSLALTLAGAALLDLIAIHRRAAPEVRRVLPRILALKTWSDVGVEVDVRPKLWLGLARRSLIEKVSLKGA